MKRGILSVFIFIFLGGGLRVIYNSGIFENRDPPWGLKVLKLKLGTFCLFAPPPTKGIFPNFFHLKIVTPSLILLDIM